MHLLRVRFNHAGWTLSEAAVSTAGAISSGTWDRATDSAIIVQCCSSCHVDCKCRNYSQLWLSMAEVEWDSDKCPGCKSEWRRVEANVRINLPNCRGFQDSFLLTPAAPQAMPAGGLQPWESWGWRQLRLNAGARPAHVETFAADAPSLSLYKVCYDCSSIDVIGSSS